MPTLVPDLADQCIIVNGVAKTYAMTGWRVGWMIGPNDVIKASTNFQSHATSNVSTSPNGPRSRRCRVRSTPWSMMRTAFERRAQDDAPHAERDPRASPASSRRERSTPTPT